MLSADDADVLAGILAAVIRARLGDVVTITAVDGRELMVTLVDVVSSAKGRSVKSATFVTELTDSPGVDLHEIRFSDVVALHVW